MLKQNLSENFQMAVDDLQGRTTITASAFVSSTKDDDSASTLTDIKQLSGGRSVGYGLTSFYSSDFALQNADKIAACQDVILRNQIGMVNYYNSIQSAAEKKEGKHLYNLVQAMKIARKTYPDQHDKLDEYWNIKMGSKKQGTKLRTRMKVGSMGDHVRFRNSKGEVTNKTVRTERGSGMTLLTTEGIKHFSEASVKIQSIYDNAIGQMSTWSNEAMLAADQEIARGISSLGIYTPSDVIINPSDLDMIKAFLSEIGKYVNVDVRDLLNSISI